MASFFSTLGTIFLTLFMFGILITIHEFGHYIVARLFNVGIIEFSIGMGPKLFSWKGKKNIFSLRLLPIGGYVNMVGEYAEEDKELSEEDKKKPPFSKKPIWQRLLVVLAGPAMNIFLGIVIMFCLVLDTDVIGSLQVAGPIEHYTTQTLVGDASELDEVPDDISGKKMLYISQTDNTDEKGFLKNDLVLSINGEILDASQIEKEKTLKDYFVSAYEKEGAKTKVKVIRNEVVVELVNPAYESEEYSIAFQLSKIEGAKESYSTSQYNMLYIAMTGNTDEKSYLEGDIIVYANGKLFTADGLTTSEAAEKLGTPTSVKVIRKNLIVELKSPTLPDVSGLAISGKLEKGDIITEVNGKNVRVYTDMSYQISRFGIKPISVTVERNGKETVVKNVVFPMASEKSVLFGEQDFRVFKKEKNFGNLMHEAFFKSISTLEMTVSSVLDTFSGRYGVEALSGPIGIGEQVGEMAKSEFPIANLLTLMVMVSLSLGVCNLLPLPVLDGGRVLLFIIEAIRRKPLNPKIESAIMTVSMVFVLLLMVLVAFKDLFSIF